MTIKNGDIPAMPQDRGIWIDGIGDCPSLATGLTRREMMAMHMMAACRSRNSDYRSWEDMANDAIEMTDALLAELECTK